MLGSTQQATVAEALLVASVYTGAAAVASHFPEIAMLGSEQQSASTPPAHRDKASPSSDTPEPPANSILRTQGLS